MSEVFSKERRKLVAILLFILSVGEMNGCIKHMLSYSRESYTGIPA